MTSEVQHNITGNYVMHGQRVIGCSCGKRFTGPDDDRAVDSPWGQWGGHFGTAYAHRMISREKDTLFRWYYTITCSCGKQFSGASFWAQNPERKFQSHQDNPDNPIWNPEVPPCGCDPRLGRTRPFCSRCGGS